MPDFQTVPHKVISRGIDRRSALNNIQPGYAEDMANFDTNDRGFVEKRKGYQAYKGSIPLRVEDIDIDSTTGYFQFNNDMNFLPVPEQPIVIYGEILQTGTGTISATSNAAGGGITVTGSGTAFSTELAVGSIIIANNGEKRTVKSIASNTSLVLNAQFTTTLPTPPGPGASFTHLTPKEYYWPTFTNEAKRTVPANTTKTFSLAHGNATRATVVSVVEAKTSGSVDNYGILPETIKLGSDINSGSITIVNEDTTSAKDFYFLVEDLTNTSVVRYTASIEQAYSSGNSLTIDIPLATHGLPNLHVLPYVYGETATNEFELIIPESVKIQANGDIEIELHNADNTTGDASGKFKGQVVILDVPGAQAIEEPVAEGDGKTVQFTGVSNDFNFYSMWERVGDVQTQVIPETIFHDDSADTLTATFTLGVSSNIKLVHTPAVVKSNIITLDMSSYPKVIDDTSPIASAWGIKHSDINYSASATKGSWTNSLEEYSSQGTNKNVVGMCGNLYEEISSSQSDVTIPTYYSDMRRRISTTKEIGPFFGLVSSKTRGVESDKLSAGINIKSITNNSENIANTAVLGLDLGPRFGDLDDLVLGDNASGYDLIEIEEAPETNYVGSFSIKSVSDNANHVTWTSVGLASLSRNSSTQFTATFDSSGEATTFYDTYLDTVGNIWSIKDDDGQVFCLTVTTDGATSLSPSGTDIVVTTTKVTVSSGVSGRSDFSGMALSTIKASTDKITTIAANSQEATITINVSDLPSYLPNHSDIQVFAQIKTDWVNFSTTNDSGTNENLPFLVGDTIVSSLFSTYPEVTYVNAPHTGDGKVYLKNVVSNIVVPAAGQLTASRTSATQVLTSVSHIVRGDTVQAFGYTREFNVINVDTSSNSITIDESITLKDSPSTASRSYIGVTGRWKTIEAPPSNDRPEYYFDSKTPNLQERLRGVSMNDSIFYTNYEDPVMKYDGQHLYKAGIPNWQPRITSYVDTDSAGIAVPKNQYLSTVQSSKTLKFATLPDLTGVNTVRLLGDDGNNSAKDLTIQSVNTEDNEIVVNETIADSTSSGHIRLPQKVAYYFKLQMTDRNNNLTSSAVTDFEECVINMTQSGTITHHLVGLPKFDLNDIEKIDILVFRSKVGISAGAPFFLVKTVPVYNEFIQYKNSIKIVDTLSNSSLLENDQVSVALKGSELPLSSSPPPRCKYLAAAANRLVLGNIKSYNQASVTLLSDTGIRELNTLVDSTISIGDGTNTLGFKFLNFMDEGGSGVTGADIGSNIRRITTIDFTTAYNSFKLTVASITDHANLVGRYVQIGSYFTDASNGHLYHEDGIRTREDRLGVCMGWWKVSATTSTTITLVSTNHKQTANFTTDPANHAQLYVAFDTASTNVPIIAIPYVSSGNTGKIVNNIVYDDTTTGLEFTSAIDRGVRDLKQAFNKVMTDETTPWALALSGSTEGSGKIIFESQLPSRTLTVTVTSGDADFADFEIFINGLRRSSADAVDGITKLFPSRLVISAPNFPEMFDKPFGAGKFESDSIVDISSADGQEITGLTTFFASSTGAAGQLESTLLVFKNKSIYAVNVDTRAVQKLESMGQGCTVPDSISPTQGGIMFANLSGIYKIDRQLKVTYVGQWLENYWTDDINRDKVEESAVAFTDSSSRKYKLSVPRGTEIKNDDVVVFDYIINPQLGDGAWTRYDNIPATAWVHTNTNSYFSNYSGQVFATRKAGDATDYRDDTSAIAASFTYAAQSFGDTGSRAIVNRVYSHFTVETSITSVTVSFSTDMNKTFTVSGDVISFSGGATDPKMQTIGISLPETRALYFQIKYDHSTIDENLILAGLDFKVKGLSEQGITQANE